MYKIFFTSKAAKEYDRLESRTQDQIDEKISLLKKGDFRMLDIAKLKGRDETYRLRSGNYRIIYEKHGDMLTITIIKIGHRKEVYRQF